MITPPMINIPCCKCKAAMWMPVDWDNLFRADHRTFYCINGHPQSYSQQPTEADLIRQERDRLKQQMAQKDDEIALERRNTQSARERAEHERKRANGYKGHAARISKRAKAGTCPCCNRTFSQLARHMQTQHPTFTPDAPEPQAETVQ